MKTEVQKRSRTEERIKLLLRWLHKAIIRWYKEHPEGIHADDSDIAYYGSACFGIDVKDNQGIARLTLEASNHHYTDIIASTHGKEIIL